MKNIIFTILIFSIVNIYGQSVLLKGDLEIDLKKGYIGGTYQFTNFQSQDTELYFTMNYQYVIERLEFNKVPQKVVADLTFCDESNLYYINANRPLQKSDTLEISFFGKFELYNSENQPEEDWKGLVLFYNDFLRAMEQSAWYPMLKAKNSSCFQNNEGPINYEISVLAKNCKSVYIGGSSPQNVTDDGKLLFKNKQPLNCIALIAGNYDWTETEKLIFLNIDPTFHTELEQETEKISDFYHKLMGIPIEEKWALAHCPSVNNFGYISDPTIVFSKKELEIDEINRVLAHEMAHYYFGNLYVPAPTTLFWVQLESVTEYFAMKYQIAANKKSGVRDKYNNFKKTFAENPNHRSFIRFDKVSDPEEISPHVRYNIVPFQLFGIENLIGQEKMIIFIKAFLRNDDKTDGYKNLINALKEAKVTDKTIQKIEDKYLKNMNLDNYMFMKKLLK